MVKKGFRGPEFLVLRVLGEARHCFDYSRSEKKRLLKQSGEVKQRPCPLLTQTHHVTNCTLLDLHKNRLTLCTILHCNRPPLSDYSWEQPRNRYLII
eukprot:5337305-Amphidinium_carterae.1